MDKASKRTAHAEHRLKRLQELRDKLCNGNAAEFARHIDGLADTYAVRMFWPLGSVGRKGLGPDMEARVRDAFKLPPGWFDLPLGTAIPSTTLVAQPQLTDSYYSNMDEESRLLRAFRLAPIPVRRNLLRQADGILEDLENPSRLNGTENPGTS